jgi:hypothetical protein
LILGTIAHYELCTTVAFIAVFLADILPQIHDIMFVCFGFGRKLNRDDSKNRFMTVTRIQTQFYIIFFNFRISKDIVLEDSNRNVKQVQPFECCCVWTSNAVACPTVIYCSRLIATLLRLDGHANITAHVQTRGHRPSHCLPMTRSVCVVFP